MNQDKLLKLAIAAVEEIKRENITDVLKLEEVFVKYFTSLVLEMREIEREEADSFNDAIDDAVRVLESYKK